jgi:hypothetical protein
VADLAGPALLVIGEVAALADLGVDALRGAAEGEARHFARQAGGAGDRQ